MQIESQRLRFISSSSWIVNKRDLPYKMNVCLPLKSQDERFESTNVCFCKTIGFKYSCIVWDNSNYCDSIGFGIIRATKRNQAHPVKLKGKKSNLFLNVVFNFRSPKLGWKQCFNLELQAPNAALVDSLERELSNGITLMSQLPRWRGQIFTLDSEAVKQALNGTRSCFHSWEISTFQHCKM